MRRISLPELLLSVLRRGPQTAEYLCAAYAQAWGGVTAVEDALLDLADSGRVCWEHKQAERVTYNLITLAA